MIKAVFLDIDNTLIDFHKCARESMCISLFEHGVGFSEDMFDVFTKINDRLWRDIELGSLTKEGLYKIRWALIFKELSVPLDGPEFEKSFIYHLSDTALPVDGALELLEYLYKKYPLYAASNAPHQQQLARLEKAGMLSYFKEVFTSERIGAQKPTEEFFTECFKIVPEKPSECIMIGDSPSADISGGKRFGLLTCLFSPSGMTGGADHTVRRLSDIRGII